MQSTVGAPPREGGETSGWEAASAPRLAGAERTAPRTELRKEIEGLRAIAVLSVLIFHVSPSVLPGGFAGVDVFFVISGYLITGLLVRELEATGTVSLRRFYARRLKRLLPMATVVILVVALCIALLPTTRWRDTAQEMVASALYWQNWLLADRSIDYFAADNAASGALRHYWSLSVEEQFCILWPLLFIAAVRFGASRRDPRRSAGTVAAAVAIASLAWSIHLTSGSPWKAYYSTSARAWEFALGGLVATFAGWEPLPSAVKRVLGLLGLALVAGSVLYLDHSTRFPGYAALAPTIGAALIVIPGAVGRWSGYGLLSSAPAQYIGSLSYSLYLWHWPLLVFFRQTVGVTGFAEDVLVLSTCLALAHHSKKFIEDPCRRPSFASRHVVAPYLFAGALILSVLVAAAAVRRAVAARSSPQGYRELIGSADYPGAAVLTGSPERARVPYLPSAVDAREDQPRGGPPGCFGGLDDTEAKLCRYGDATSAMHVVLMGDSHAMHWIPALVDIADRKGWRLTAITKASCAFAPLELSTSEGLPNESCLQWDANALGELKRLSPSLVVIAQSVGLHAFAATNREEDVELLASAYAKRWKELQEIGARVAVIRETPRPGFDVPYCLTALGGSIEACSRPRGKVFPMEDPLVVAARRTPGVNLIDMTDALCNAERCDPVIGNVLVWRDSHHLTASYVRTMGPALERALSPSLEDRG